jgi:ubiquitin-protein ligase
MAIYYYFAIRSVFEQYPKEPPLIKLRNPVFHKLVDSTGTLKYLPFFDFAL